VTQALRPVPRGPKPDPPPPPPGSASDMEDLIRRIARDEVYQANIVLPVATNVKDLSDALFILGDGTEISGFINLVRHLVKEEFDRREDT